VIRRVIKQNKEEKKKGLKKKAEIMAEEHRFQAPEGHRLCANNCGFLGSPATMNLCSKCYRAIQLKQEQDALAKAALDTTQTLKGSSLGTGSGSTSGCKTTSESSSGLKLPGSTEVVRVVSVEPTPIVQPPVQPNRCLTCRKRVGLTGFKCKCGSMFCGSHRYPEQHGCTFDYKKVGKEAIAKANPLVKAAKLDKI